MKFKPIYALIFSTRKMCRENVTGSRADIIKRDLGRTLTLLKIYSIGVMLCITSYAVLPLKNYILNDELTPLFPMEIIFCDQSMLSGFLSATFLQFILGIFSGLATIMYASTF